MYEESFRFWKRLLEVHPEEVILAHLEVKSISLMYKLEIVNILYYYIRMIPESIRCRSRLSRPDL